MSPATKTLLFALIRFTRGALSECEKWLQAQDEQSPIGMKM